MHKNACTTPLSRAVIVQEVLQKGHGRRSVTTARRLSEKTVRKWTKRHGEGGESALERTEGLSRRWSAVKEMDARTPSAGQGVGLIEIRIFEVIASLGFILGIRANRKRA